MSVREGIRKPVVSGLATLMALAMLAGAPDASWAAAPRTPTAVQVAEGARARRLIGLPATPRRVRALLAGREDVGTSAWGIPMTRSEADRVDLDARVRFAEVVDREIMPLLRPLSTFAGAWLDQANGGRLVVMLTRRDPGIEAEVRRRLPVGSPGVVLRLASRTYRELKAAQARAVVDWASLAPSIRVEGVSIDVPANTLRLRVPQRQRARAQGFARELGASLGVPAIVVGGSRGRDLACRSRDDCTPIRPGVRVHRGSGAPSRAARWASSWSLAAGPRC